MDYFSKLVLSSENVSIIVNVTILKQIFFFHKQLDCHLKAGKGLRERLRDEALLGGPFFAIGNRQLAIGNGQLPMANWPFQLAIPNRHLATPNG